MSWYQDTSRIRRRFTLQAVLHPDQQAAQIFACSDDQDWLAGKIWTFRSRKDTRRDKSGRGRGCGDEVEGANQRDVLPST